MGAALADPIEPEIACVVDARGLLCPHPLLLARAALRELAPGAIVQVLATDPLAAIDLHAYCLRVGHEWMGEVRDHELRRFLIRRGGL